MTSLFFSLLQVRCADFVIVKTPSGLSRQPSAQAFFRHTKNDIRFSTLDAICKALDYQPGDILEYQPPAESPCAESHQEDSL